MFRRAILVLIVLAFVVPSGNAEEEPARRLALEFHSVEPFVVDLWGDRLPASAAVVDDDHPLKLEAARGEEESAVLAVRALAKTLALTFTPSDLEGGPRDIELKHVSLKIICSVRRHTVYTRLYADRFEKRYSDAHGIFLPDILANNEHAVERLRKEWRGSLEDEGETPEAHGTALAKDHIKYLLYTVRVGENMPAGTYKGTVTVSQGGERAAVPVELTVRPVTLKPVEGAILTVSNDFARPGQALFEPGLKLLRRLGMNSTRIGPVTSRPDAEAVFATLRKHGFLCVVQNTPPRTKKELETIPEDIRVVFYGVDEPQPKDRERGDWSKMARHVRISKHIHDLGGKVMTSLPYPFALELRNPKSRLYEKLEDAGVFDHCEPLDWAGYGLGLQRLGRRPDPNAELFAYIGTLQKEFRAGSHPLPSKNPWTETYYWPQGLMRYPFYARLLYGFYLFNSHLDGAQAWTLYRGGGGNPLAHGKDHVASLAYPAKTMIYSTYNLEAIREGIDDFRYARQAYRATAALGGD
ncbi:MAG: hypothetical protein ACYTAF_14970, partial [Planctomycetota bacterium]